MAGTGTAGSGVGFTASVGRPAVGDGEIAGRSGRHLGSGVHDGRRNGSDHPGNEDDGETGGD